MAYDGAQCAMMRYKPYDDSENNEEEERGEEATFEAWMPRLRPADAVAVGVMADRVNTT